VLTLLWVVAAPLQAEGYLQPFATEYTVHYNGFKVGEMKQQLSKRRDGRYQLDTEVYTTGLVAWFKSDRILERSIFDVQDGAVRPASYRYHYTGRNKDVVERLDFDWDKMQVVSLRDGKEKRMPLTPGTYDKQVYQVAMRRDLGKDIKHFRYPIAERGKMEKYKLDVSGSEKVMTTFGEVDAVVVKKGTTTLWLAKDHNYLVVKIEQNEDGNLATSYITSKKP
jgi:hypothetical protein